MWSCAPEWLDDLLPKKASLIPGHTAQCFLEQGASPVKTHFLVPVHSRN